MRTIRLLVLALAALVGSSVAWSQLGEEKSKLEKCELGSINRIHSLGGVFLAGQPKPEELKLAKEKGVKTVISLRGRNEIDWDEEAAVKNAGMEFVHLPFRSAETLTDDIFDRARNLLSDKSKQPILLH
jgi:protein tyrosine phosphatase (PTP) superfamily phosphohydrolase (DUF442 family)